MLNTCWILLNQRKTTNAKYENDFHCGPWMSDKCDRILFNLNCHAIFLHMCQDTTRETECEHILTINLYFYRFLCGKPKYIKQVPWKRKYSKLPYTKPLQIHVSRQVRNLCFYRIQWKGYHEVKIMDCLNLPKLKFRNLPFASPTVSTPPPYNFSIPPFLRLLNISTGWIRICMGRITQFTRYTWSSACELYSFIICLLCSSCYTEKLRLYL